MKKTLCFVGTLLCAVCCLAGSYHKWERMIPMRDGTSLYTAIYLPNDSLSEHPILLYRTPYSCRPYGDSIPDLGLYGEQNYIIVRQDVRGRYRSEGAFVDVRPYIPNKQEGQVDEASDTYDTIEWLLTHLPHHNGRVAAQGVSYVGFYAWQAGMSGHPALRVVLPQAPVTDWWRGDDIHHNGAFNPEYFQFAQYIGMPRQRPDSVESRCITTRPESLLQAQQENTPYDFFLRTPTDTLSRGLQQMGCDYFWNLICLHPDYDAFWQERDASRYAAYQQAAVVLTGGWYDGEDLYGPLRLYRSLQGLPAADVHLIMGPWTHGGWQSECRSLGAIGFGGEDWSSWYKRQVEIPLLNHYLLDNPTDMAPVCVFYTGENRWRHYAVWPPENQQPTDYYLHAEGKLSTEAPTQRKSYSQYTADPLHPTPVTARPEDWDKQYMFDDQTFASQRKDVLCFVSEPLTDSLRIAGAIEISLQTALSREDADFVVKIIDWHPNAVSSNGHPQTGMQEMVRADIMRGRYRNSFSHPEPFQPGEITPVNFTLNDVAHCFPAGHRILIQVQSFLFPLFDRNPQHWVENIYHAQASDFQAQEIRIYHQRNAASRIRLPIVP